LARFNLDAGAFSLAFELRDVDASRLRENETKAVLNLLSRLSASARKGVAVEMKLGKRVSGSKVKEIFGDYFRVVRGIERFLP